VACSLTFNPKNFPDKEFLSQLNDSKKLTEKKRDELFEVLIEKSRGENPEVFFGV
jgi:ribonuclease HII